MVDLLLTALLANGHVLIEGLPGVAKTLTAKLLSSVIAAKFSRIQFTPDLMPSDVLGTSVFNPQTTQFEFRQGAIFANMVLIDEINRAPAKTQSALFEVMEERQITMDGKTYPMDTPFMVLATQNPIEQEGTYRLPEAQLDRFLFKITVGYPSFSEEIEILNRLHQRPQNSPPALSPVLDPTSLTRYRQYIQQIHVQEDFLRYIAQIVHQTRHHPALYLGASPRASLAILAGAKAYAAVQGRDFITPDDVKFISPHVLVHRLVLTPEKEMEGLALQQVINQILQSVEVPR
jgi:MoxR-like ATPase